MTLKELREQNKKTVTEVANALKVTTRAVYNYENGWREISIRHTLILSELYEETAEEVIRAQLNSYPSDR